MKPEEDLNLPMQIETKLNMAVSTEDLINVEAVKYERNLKAQREALVKDLDAVEKLKRETQKTLLTMGSAYAEKLFKKAIANMNKSYAALSKIAPDLKLNAELVKNSINYKEDVDGVLYFTVTLQINTVSDMSSLSKRKDAQIEGKLYNYLSFFPNAGMKKTYADLIDLGKQTETIHGLIRDVDNQLREMPFKLKELRAEITKNTLASNKQGAAFLQLISGTINNGSKNK